MTRRRWLWFNDEYPLNERRRDAVVAEAFEAAGLDVHRFTDSLIRAPGSVVTGNGDPSTGCSRRSGATGSRASIRTGRVP